MAKLTRFFQKIIQNIFNFAVAPLAGAWIEMQKRQMDEGVTKVAPLAGAWIEINEVVEDARTFLVAPLAGAWIEINRR